MTITTPSSTYNPQSANPIYHIAFGIRFFFSGLRLLFGHPRLLGLSLIPILITTSLLIGFAVGVAWMMGEVIADTFGLDVKLFAQTLIFVLALFAGYFLYLPVARVLLAPFSEALSRKTHAINSGGANYRNDLDQSKSGWLRAMFEGLKLVAFQFTIIIIAFALGVIVPPVGAVVGIVMAILTCCLDFCDVPLSARGLPFGKKLGWLWRNKSLAVGFGIAAYLSLLIPVVNLFSLPAGVIGATLLTDSVEGK